MQKYTKFTEQQVNLSGIYEPLNVLKNENAPKPGKGCTMGNYCPIAVQVDFSTYSAFQFGHGICR